MHIREIAVLDIAIQQLDRASQLYLETTDFISILTLAGAADEIFGKVLKSKGLPNALENWAEVFAQIREIHTGEKPTQSHSIGVLNQARNDSKHYNGIDIVYFDPEFEAKQMLDRAITNLTSLQNTSTESISKAFLKLHSPFPRGHEQSPA